MSAIRRDEVDVLRGAALLGICVVNVPVLAGVDLLAVPEATADRVAAALVAMLFQGKFFVLFSFLFGWGFAVWREATHRAGRGVGAAWSRRLACLFALGVAHALLVFVGDILVLYSLLGVALWALRDASPRRLLGIAAALSGVAALALALLGVLLSEPPGGTLLTDTNGYGGSFVDAVRQRFAEWPFALDFVLLFNGPLALAAFCAGLAAAAGDFFTPGSSAYGALRRRWPLLLAAGLTLNGAYALAVGGLLGDGGLALLAFSGLAFGGPCLASVYLIGIVELVRRRAPPRSLTAAGRLSLTAYVAEGAIAGLLFNGYGLGLYGRTGDLACLALAVAVYAAVHGLCHLWSRALGQGPLERLLRAAAYGGLRSRSPRGPNDERRPVGSRRFGAKTTERERRPLRRAAPERR